MAGSLKNEPDAAFDYCAHSLAAADCRVHVAAGRETPANEGPHQLELNAAGACHFHHPVALDTATNRTRLHWCVPAQQLAGAVWHRAGRRSPVSLDAGAHRDHRQLRLAVRHGSLGPGRCQFPCTVSDSVDGVVRRVSDSRSVQSVCVLRSAAGSVLRANAPRFGQSPGVSRVALHLDQPAGIVPVPDRCRADLRGHRHVEHG